MNQQKFIEDHLNRNFMCYNPEAKDFKIWGVLSQIFQFIYLKE